MITRTVSLLLTLVSSLAFAQATPPKPGPEHQKLAGLVGTWVSKGESTANPLEPAQKWTSNIKAEWHPGRFAVVRHFITKGTASGEIVALDIITYDAVLKAHTWYSLDSVSGAGLGRGSITGNTLTAVWEVPAKGKLYKMRGTLKGLGSDTMQWTQEYSEDGKTWKQYARATDTRVKSK
jgi:hypothetical protein